MCVDIFRIFMVYLLLLEKLRYAFANTKRTLSTHSLMTDTKFLAKFRSDEFFDKVLFFLSAKKQYFPINA